MGVLAAASYDPATAVTKSTAALLAMTALDTTNLRLTFTAPASGRVYVRIKSVLHGATTCPATFLGILEGTTVRARYAPSLDWSGAQAATSLVPAVVEFIVSGLTPSASVTWDAAYGVETIVAATGFKYGGPNDATTNNAFGAIVFEVWEA